MLSCRIISCGEALLCCRKLIVPFIAKGLRSYLEVDSVGGGIAVDVSAGSVICHIVRHYRQVAVRHC